MRTPSPTNTVDELTVLIVDDEPRVLDALEAVLAAEFRVLRAGQGPDALRCLADEPDVAVILTDQRMPGMSGIELLRQSQERNPDTLRIVLTAHTDVDSLMDAINTGQIYHFLPKPWDPHELLLVVRRAAERWRLTRENARLRDELELAYNALRREAAAVRERPTSFDSLVGAETGLRDAVALARKILDADTTVLLLGETGTGKELFARLLHANGPRRTPSRSSPRTAAPCPSRCSSPSCSAMRVAPSPAPPASERGSSRRLTAARSSSTRSARPPRRCSSGSCGCSRRARSGRSAVRRRGAWTCA